MALKKIRNEVSGTIFSLPFYVAKELGYFEAEGLDVELSLPAATSRWGLAMA